MNVLVLGATGFIGSHAADALTVAGHAVRRAGRGDFDLTRLSTDSAWCEKLSDIDVVLNSAGILRESAQASFDDVHAIGPIALFEHCAARGIRVLQISALGADAGGRSAFHQTKRRADDALLALSAPCAILQPSLVFGSDGKSAQWLMTLASLPVIPLPGRGDHQIQPVHVDDLCAAIVAIVSGDRFDSTRIAAVGPEATSLRRYLETLRGQLDPHGGRARFVNVPLALARRAAALRIGMLDRDTLGMLERGNTGNPAAFSRLLGHPPRAPREFIGGDQRDALRILARLRWTLPLLRYSIAIVWLAAGVVSAGLYPVADSLVLLAATGLSGMPALFALYGAAALDVVLGIATLVLPKRRWLWIAQIAVIAAYTVIITVFLPEQWLHPYGPVVKNLPLLAAIVLLHQLERPRR